MDLLFSTIIQFSIMFTMWQGYWGHKTCDIACRDNILSTRIIFEWHD